VVGLVEPLKRGILRRETDIDERDVKWRDVLLLRSLPERREELFCFGPFPGHRIGMSESPRNFGPPPRQCQTFLKLADGILILALLLVGPSEVQMGLREVWIELEGLHQFFSCGVVLTRIVETPPHLRADDEGEWLQFLPSLVL